MFPGMPSSARTALSETVFGETQARSSLAQGKDALANLRKGNKVFARSLAVQLGRSQTAFKDRAATFGTSVSEGVGIPAVPGSVRLRSQCKDWLIVPRFLLPLRQLFRCWIIQLQLGVNLLRMVLLYSTTSQAGWPLGFPGCKGLGPLVLPVKVVGLAARSGSNLARERSRQYTLQEGLDGADSTEDYAGIIKQHRTAPGRIAGLGGLRELTKFLSRSWEVPCNGRRVRSNLKDKPQLGGQQGERWTRWGRSRTRWVSRVPHIEVELLQAPGPPSGIQALNPTRCWIGLQSSSMGSVKCWLLSTGSGRGQISRQHL